MLCLASEVLFHTINELALLLSEIEVALGPPGVLNVAKSGPSFEFKPGPPWSGRPSV